MQVINNESVIFFDVDDTLVMWDISASHTSYLDIVIVIDPYDGKPLSLGIHKPHVKLLINQAKRGSKVVVWSQGGFQWAEAVVKALQLEEYVDIVMSKPKTYVDDLPVEAWLKDRVYIKPDSPWGAGE